MTTWRGDKRAANLKKHGVDLALAAAFEHEAALVQEATSEAYGEQRFRAIGPIGDSLYVDVYTIRTDGDDEHAISLRLAEPREVRSYVRNVDRQ